MSLDKIWDGSAWVVPSVVDLAAYARKDQVPSLEETITSTQLAWGGQTDSVTLEAATVGVGGRGSLLMIAPFPLIVLSVDLAFNQTLPASATNYWTFTLRNHVTVGTRTDIVSMSMTAGTGGDWERVSFANAVWDPNNRLLPAGNKLGLWAFVTGAPVNLSGISNATIRYARQ